MRDLSRTWKACLFRGPLALGLVLGMQLVASGTAQAARPQENNSFAPVFQDDVESGGALWVVDTATPNGAPWAIVTTQAHSPTHSWSTDDPALVSDKRVAFANDVTVGGGSTLSFWLRWTTENTFDGTVLEYSLDGGTTWTDILAAQGTVPADANRITQAPYNVTISGNFSSPIANRRAWSGTQATFVEVRVNVAAFAGLATRFRWRFASDVSVASTGVWLDDVQIAAALEPVSLAVDAGGNGVIEPNETATVAPTWSNTTAAAVATTGALSNFTGPSGPTYTIVDGTADYGSIPAAGSAPCTDCYSVMVSGARPFTHWDSNVTETLTPGGITKGWTLHIGASFTDVPTSNIFYKFIETLIHKGVTGGCGTDIYCPSNNTTREQIAVFALVSKEGVGYVPPACSGTPMFADVPITSPFCPWIQELATRGVVSGCGGGNYCPSNSVTREQMSVIVLRTLEPTTTPDPCATAPYLDVPTTSPFCPYIQELTNRGVVAGCGNGNYCPSNPVTREQMSVFLSATFGLTLYGI